MSQETENLQRTPLFDAHVKAGGKMVPFGGWEMPLHYGSQLDEHLATRSAVGLFDVSHMGQVEITGPDALQLADAIVTANVADLKDGEEVYCVMVREDGSLIDDLIVSRFAEDDFLLVVNASTYPGDLEQMKKIQAAKGLNATLNGITENWGMIAVQGPDWLKTCTAVLGDGDWQSLKPFRTLRMQWQGEPMIFSMTGYTGEPGCELLVPPAKAVDLWDTLIEAGGRPCGLAARDTLRLEKGYCLSGQDFTAEHNPYEANLAWVVKLKGGDFCGKTALESIKAEGPKRKLVGILPQGRRMARHDAKIFSGDEVVGQVTSGSFSPSLEIPIAMGYVATELAKPGTELEIEIGRGRVPGEVVKLPFV